MVKYIVALTAALVIALTGVGYLIYNRYQMSETNDLLNSELMEANLEIGRAHTLYGNAQAKNEKLQKDLQDYLKKNNELIVAYGELEAKYDAVVNNTEVPTDVTTGDPIACDVPSFSRGMLYEAITENTLTPVDSLQGAYQDHRLFIGCLVKPYPNSDRNIPMFIGYNLHLSIGGQVVETYTESGAVNHYVNLFELDDKGNRVGEFKLSRLEFVVNKPDKSKFFWFNPKLDIGVFAGYAFDKSFTTGGTLGMSFMSWGLTENDLTFKFLRLGLDASSNRFGVSFAPAMWNAGSVIPVISNLWVSPAVTFAFSGAHSLSLQLTVGL